MGQSSSGPDEPRRRQVAFVCGRWRVTYLVAGGPEQRSPVRRGVIEGPLVPDRSMALWVAVTPEGGRHRTMIRREWITSITLR